MIIENEKFTEKLIDEDSLFICALGYEQRSYYLFDKVNSKIDNNNKIVFVFEDCDRFIHTNVKRKEIEKENSAIIHQTKYEDCFEIQRLILDSINEKKKVNKELVIHIDYSSMPRCWYCGLPKMLENVLRKEDKVYFWYVRGVYPERYEEYPSAGIDSFALFSGNPSLRTENKRFHVLALSYDTIRTKAMISILDPDSTIVLNAYDSNDKEISENVKDVNRDIIAQSRMSISTQLDDFSFMIAKLCELAYEYQPLGDVIFVPDGPKPLIFAMSLIPDLVNLRGVTCLHISRNQQHFNAIDINPKGSVMGFSMCMYNNLC